VFYVSDGRLLTPPLDEHILASITRALVIEVTGAQEQPCTLDELYAADEVFFASTVREVQTVASIDDHEYTGPAPVTDRAREAVTARIAEQLRG